MKEKLHNFGFALPHIVICIVHTAAQAEKVIMKMLISVYYPWKKS